MAAHDRVLLQEGDRVVGDPVDNQTARKRTEHEHEDPWHPCKDHLLCRISGSWVQFLLKPHRDTEQDW